MGMLKGVDVTLYVNNQVSVDDFNRPVYEQTTETVHNIIIEPASNEAIMSEYELYGKRIAYTLHIPKDDTHEWSDTIVEFYGNKYRTYGDCLIYDPNLTPLSWNKKVKVERYE